MCHKEMMKVVSQQRKISGESVLFSAIVLGTSHKSDQSGRSLYSLASVTGSGMANDSIRCTGMSQNFGWDCWQRDNYQ